MLKKNHLHAHQINLLVSSLFAGNQFFDFIFFWNFYEKESCLHAFRKEKKGGKIEIRKWKCQHEDDVEDSGKADSKEKYIIYLFLYSTQQFFNKSPENWKVLRIKYVFSSPVSGFIIAGRESKKQ